MKGYSIIFNRQFWLTNSNVLAARLYDAVMLIIILIAITIPAQLIGLPPRQEILSLDVPMLQLPRVGFDVLEHISDTSRTFRWTTGSGQILLPHPGDLTSVRLLLASGPHGATPASIQVGSQGFMMTIAPALRRYSFLLPATQYEQISLMIDSPTVTVHKRSVGVLVSEVSIHGAGSWPAVVTLGLILATISWFSLLRYNRVPLLRVALLVVLALSLAQGWYIVDGWRYAIFSSLLLFLAGIGAMVLVLEQGLLTAANTPPSIARTVGILLVALACVRLPCIVLSDPGPGSLMTSVAVACVGSYMALRHYRVPILLNAIVITMSGALLLVWYAVGGWVPGVFDSVLLLMSIGALLIVGRAQWSIPLLGYAAVIIITGLGLVAYASQYFFLFDDFGILDSSQHQIGELFSSTVAGFYRPVVFLLLKMEFTLFGWHAPSGYMISSIIGHGINALFVALLGRRILNLDWRYAIITFMLFLLSPWAFEVVFWMSCQFDIVATAGILVTLLLAVRLTQTTRSGSYALQLGLVGVLALLSLLAKETAVTLPGLFALLVTAQHGSLRPATSARFWMIEMVLVAMLALSLIMRGHALQSLGGTFGGAYGNYFALLGKVKSLNVTDAFLNPPGTAQPSTYDQMAHIVYGLIILLFLSSAYILDFHRAVWLTLAFIVAALPVIWIGTISGRLVYTPGVFMVLLLTLGIRALYQRLANLRIRATLLCGGVDALVIIVGIYALTGLGHQKLVWAQSNDIARQTLQVFAIYKDDGAHFHMKELPFAVANAYVLKPNAFPLYYHRDMDVQAERGYLGYWRSSLLFQGKQVLADAQQRPEETTVTFHVRDIK